jgi:hypothetical protein
MVCGTKRIRSLNLPWMTGVTSKLATTTPPKGPASLFTITAAITPRRDAFADLPAPGGLARLRRGRSPCLRYHPDCISTDQPSSAENRGPGWEDQTPYPVDPPPPRANSLTWKGSPFSMGKLTYAAPVPDDVSSSVTHRGFSHGSH